jgi:hypothetical protein
MAFLLPCCCANTAASTEVIDIEIWDQDACAADQNAGQHTHRLRGDLGIDVCLGQQTRKDVAENASASLKEDGSDTQSTTSGDFSVSFRDEDSSHDVNSCALQSSTELVEGAFLQASICDSTQEVLAEEKRTSWWSEANIEGVKGLQDAIHITRLREAFLMENSGAWSSNPDPFEQLAQMCEEVNLDASNKNFVNVRLHIGKKTLLLICEVLDMNRLEQCLEADPVGKRIKLVWNPVQIKLPFPATEPKNAQTIGANFGKYASLSRKSTSAGGETVTIQVDLFSKWVLKTVLQRVGFRPGNVVEVMLVDWAGPCEKPGVLAACKLSLKEEYVHLLS